MEVNKILQGNSLKVLKTLPDESIDMAMTSPPYWMLRDYKTDDEIWDGKEGCEHNWQEITTPSKSGNKNTEGMSVGSNISLLENDSQGYGGKPFVSNFCSKCGVWKGSLGLEPTFDLFIKHLCDIFDEVKRVLKKGGSCWVNLGDTYHGGNLCVGQPEDWESISTVDKEKYDSERFNETIKQRNKSNYPKKSLVMIPFRFAIEMVSRGWILRNTIIWHKPACMPQSVTDRFTTDFEYLFFFTKNQKYFFNQQFEDFADATKERVKYNYSGNKLGTDREMVGYCEGDLSHILNNEGRNKRTVWSINTESFSEAHFAVYPQALCETPIKAGCPEFVCIKCGKAREKIVESIGLPRDRTKDGDMLANNQQKEGESDISGGKLKEWKKKHPDKFKGYTDCGCGDKFEGGIVLDPFFGAGTTGLVALKQNKKFIGIELSEEYIKIAEKRLKPYKEQTKLNLFEVTND